MIPKGGGLALPPAPDCLAGEHWTARKYLQVLDRAMKQTGWSGAQRVRLKNLWRKWTLYAEGRDPHFEKYGTFPRVDGATPPTQTDKTVAGWRKLHPLTPEERKRRKMPRRFR